MTTDSDLILLRDAIDLRGATDADPGDDFWAALRRQHKLLTRAAKRLGLEVPVDPKDPLPPGTIRTCASFLLAD